MTRLDLGLAALGCGLALAGRGPAPTMVRARLAARLNDRSGARAPTTVRPRSPRSLPSSALPLAAAGACAMVCVAVAGAAGLVAALVLMPVAVLVTRRVIARSPPPADRAGRSALPLTCDLIAAGLRAGASVPTALTSAAGTASGSVRTELDGVAGLLRLGTSAPQAWGGLLSDPVLGSVAAVAARSADSGIRLADALTRRAAHLREDLHASAVARADRVGVLALVPLGLCFLPAFICLGVVPIVAGIAADVFSRVAP